MYQLSIMRLSDACIWPAPRHIWLPHMAWLLSRQPLQCVLLSLRDCTPLLSLPSLLPHRHQTVNFNTHDLALLWVKLSGVRSLEMLTLAAPSTVCLPCVSLRSPCSQSMPGASVLVHPAQRQMLQEASAKMQKALNYEEKFRQSTCNSALVCNSRNQVSHIALV